MWIRAFGKKTAISVLLLLCICFLAVFLFSFFLFSGSNVTTDGKVAEKEKKFIQWVDFNVPLSAMESAMEEDIKRHDTEKEVNWVELLAYLAAKYGGNWKQYRRADLDVLLRNLDSGTEMAHLTEKMKYYSYYREAYGAVLDGFLGEFEIGGISRSEPDVFIRKRKYGLKVFSPIARGYGYSDYDDFGSSRSYGYQRKHLGHDLLGSIGTPVIAVESGIVERIGWNQYGGWRIGIRSFDSKRYYYYAHLRKNHPYNDLSEGKIVKAGDVIGYLGMTGYSVKENVNNINTPHLHFGMQLIFDPSQEEGNHEIWIDVYAITKLLERNRCTVYKDAEKKEYYRSYPFFEPGLEKYGMRAD